MTMLRCLRNHSLQRALLQVPRPIVPSPIVRFPATQLPLVLEKLDLSTFSRNFHTTVPVSFAVRRRKRQAVAPTPTSEAEYDSDDEEDGGDRPQLDAVVDLVQFQQGGDALLEKIQIALEPMKRANDHFFVTRGTEDDIGDFLLIDVGPVHGQYTLQIDLEQRCLVFQTPISGQHTYRLSESKGEWMDEIDGHAFEGLLVRDLIRQVKGIPKL
jgi:hypothetical protein